MVLSDPVKRTNSASSPLPRQGRVDVSGALIHGDETVAENDDRLLVGWGLVGERPGAGQSDVQGDQGDRADFGLLSNQQISTDRIQGQDGRLLQP